MARHIFLRAKDPLNPKRSLNTFKTVAYFKNQAWRMQNGKFSVNRISENAYGDFNANYAILFLWHFAVLKRKSGETRGWSHSIPCQMLMLVHVCFFPVRPSFPEISHLWFEISHLWWKGHFLSKMSKILSKLVYPDVEFDEESNGANRESLRASVGEISSKNWFF